jgi:hypothetical protein
MGEAMYVVTVTEHANIDGVIEANVRFKENYSEM